MGSYGIKCQHCNIYMWHGSADTDGFFGFHGDSARSDKDVDLINTNTVAGWSTPKIESYHHPKYLWENETTATANQVWMCLSLRNLFYPSLEMVAVSKAEIETG